MKTWAFDTASRSDYVVARAFDLSGVEEVGSVQVGIFDAGQRAERRFGALFNIADAVSDYGSKARIVLPAPGPRSERKT